MTAGEAEWARRSISHTTNQIPQTMVTTRKLGGRLNIADAPNPIHTDATLSTVEIAIATAGRGVSVIAVAAGVTTKREQQ